MPKKLLILILLIIAPVHFAQAEVQEISKQKNYRTIHQKKKKSPQESVANALAKEKKSLLRKNPKDLSIAELKKSIEYAIQEKNLDFAIQCVEQLLLQDIAENHDVINEEFIRQLRLQLGDLYFDNNDMKKAARAYRIYIKFYPGNKKDLDYAKYKEILCRFYMCLKPPLDQTKTYRTLALANEYLEQPDNMYKQEVSAIRRNCYEYIFEYEASIVVFNAKAKQPTQERLSDLKKELKPVINEFELKIIDLEIALAEIESKPELLAQKKAERATRLPEGSMLLAQNNKRNLRDRF